MFNNNIEDEADFCQAYKSEILSNVAPKETSSLNTISKVLTILLLLLVIIAVSIYGYNYIIENGSSSSLPPSSVQMIEDDELIVSPEEEEVPVNVMPPKMEESDIDTMAKEVQSVISKNEKNITPKKNIENPLEVPTTVQSEYLDELSKLSDEIDKK